MQYPPGMVEQLRARNARFEGDPPPPHSDPFQSPGAPQGGYWKAGVDDEATSIFSPDQIEEAARRSRSKSLIPEAPPPRATPSRPSPAPARDRAAPDLRRVPDHGPTGMFHFAEPPTQKPPAAPGAGGGFEEEPTALFMSEGEVQRVDLRAIPDHGKTGLIYPTSREEVASAPPSRSSSPVGRASIGSSAAPPPRMPAPATPVGRASPAGMEAPSAPMAPPRSTEPAPPVRVGPPPQRATGPGGPRGAGPIVVERPVSPLDRASSPVSSIVPMEIAISAPSSMEPMAASQPASPESAFPETASGVRRGATLDEIMRLKVAAPPPEPAWKKTLPKVALTVLVLLAVGAALAVAAAIATLAFR